MVVRTSDMNAVWTRRDLVPLRIMIVRDIVCLRTEKTKLHMWKVRNCGRLTKGDIASDTCRVQAKILV
jgi:hypothetical protein